jgi:hypothetical protein
MEDPGTWDEATRVIQKAINMWNEADALGMIGLSLAMYIRRSLEQANLLPPLGE